MADLMPSAAVVSRRSLRSLAAKRFADVVVSCALLITTLPILAGAALAIVVTSGWPVFYCGKRWGRDETQFTCYKLRTMRVDQADILRRNGLVGTATDGRTIVYEDDPRIDRVGAFLRRYSIDELPQLFNVLRGDMSMIGPRALAISMLDDVPDIRRARLVVTPGMSGLWQVRNRRKNVGIMDMLADDIEYINTFSLALDLRIALKTLGKLVEPTIEAKPSKRNCP